MSRQLYQHMITVNSFGIKDKIQKERKPFNHSTKKRDAS
jgi:hypothetical protein